MSQGAINFNNASVIPGLLFDIIIKILSFNGTQSTFNSTLASNPTIIPGFVSKLIVSLGQLRRSDGSEFYYHLEQINNFDDLKLALQEVRVQIENTDFASLGLLVTLGRWRPDVIKKELLVVIDSLINAEDYFQLNLILIDQLALLFQ